MLGGPQDKLVQCSEHTVQLHKFLLQSRRVHLDDCFVLVGVGLYPSLSNVKPYKITNFYLKGAFLKIKPHVILSNSLEYTTEILVM